jgi:hypothetical protein
VGDTDHLRDVLHRHFYVSRSGTSNRSRSLRGSLFCEDIQIASFTAEAHCGLSHTSCCRAYVLFGVLYLFQIYKTGFSWSIHRIGEQLREGGCGGVQCQIVLGV